MPTRTSTNPFDDDGEDGGDDFDVHHQQSPTRVGRGKQGGRGSGPRPANRHVPPPPPSRGALSPPGVGVGTNMLQGQGGGRSSRRAPSGGKNPFDDSFSSTNIVGRGGQSASSSPFSSSSSPLRNRGGPMTKVLPGVGPPGSRFPSSALAMLGAPASSIPSAASSLSSLPPIFSTRHVMEWPLPSVVKHTLYAKLWLTTQKLHGSGNVRLHVSTGVSATIFSAEESFYALADASDAASLKYIGNNDNTNSLVSGSRQQQQHTRGGSDGAAAGSTFTGYLKNFLPVGGGGGAGDTNSASSADKLAALASMDDAALDALLTDKSVRKVYPPAPKCVACSNGWIVSAMECESSIVPSLAMLNDTSGISSVHHVTSSGSQSQSQSSG